MSGLPDSFSMDRIVAVLYSRSLLERIVNELDLVPLLVTSPGKNGGRNPLNVAVEVMTNRILSVLVDERSQTITVRAEYPDPVIAQAIAGTTIVLLNQILNEKELTNGEKTMETLEGQISQETQKIRDLESLMARLQSDSGIMTPGTQMTGVIALYSHRIEQKMALEVEMRLLQNILTADNPRVLAARAQLNEVNDQIRRIETSTGVGSLSIGNAPKWTMEYVNIERKLGAATTVYQGLESLYETQRLKQSQEQPFVQVIDPALVPDAPEKPPRAAALIIGLLAGLVAGVAIALSVEIVGYARRRLLVAFEYRRPR